VRKAKFLMVVIVVAAASYLSAATNGNRYCNVKSFDGEIISYNVCGSGKETLVFVHGWSCDSRYWHQQVPYFAKKYQVVTIDLAGHGHSSQNRKIYSPESFGHDIKAVVEDVNARKVILIGHSMGGEIVACAARLMPERVIGIVGVDTLQNVEDTMDKEVFAKMVESFQKDFKGEVGSFVESMLGKNIKPELKKWIIDDMSSAPPYVAISAFKEYVPKFENKGMANIFKDIRCPIRCVNADLWPTNPQANRRYMSSFDVAIMKDCGHFVMLEKPKEFNKLLDSGIKEIIKKAK
jgi:pimeloyl-ACP methyl ester carboxylesterase